MIHPYIRHLITMRYEGKWRNQQPKGMPELAWQKLTPERMVDLLASASSLPRYEPDGPSTSYLAGELLRNMQRKWWRIRAGLHTGGKGDERGVDYNLHITLTVGSTTYHVTCKEDPQLHIIRITD
jgi:hypothetical protein